MLTIKNRVGTSLVLFIIISLGLTACGPPGPRALLEGKKLLDDGKYEQAILRLQTAATLLSTNAIAWNYLGLAFHNAGRPNEAERAYQKALSFDRDLSEAHYNLGCLFFSQGRLEPAKSEFTTYTLRRANVPEGLIRLGTTQLRLKELGGAEKSFTEAVRLNPTNAEALTGLGMVRAQRGRAGDAMQFFAQAVKSQPDYAPAVLNQAIIAHEYLRDRQTALDHYREYLALRPTAENAEAIKAIVRQLEPDLAPPRPAVATAAPQPQPDRAKTASQSLPAPRVPAPETGRATPPSRPAATAKAAAPTPPPAANLQSVQVSAEPAIASAQDVTVPAAAAPTEGAPAQKGPPVAPSSAATKPASSPKRSLLQRINPLNLLASNAENRTTPAESAGKNQSAPVPASEESASNSVAGSRRYVYVHPAKPAPGTRADAERAQAQGVQSQQGRRLAEAIRAYKRATQLDPAYFDAWYNLGVASGEAGNTQAALTAYECALAVRPESLDARYNFALLLKQSKYYLDSATELERILSVYPNEARSHLALGNLYAQQLNQPAKARAHYLKVLQVDPQNPQAPAIRYWLARQGG